LLSFDRELQDDPQGAPPGHFKPGDIDMNRGLVEPRDQLAPTKFPASAFRIFSAGIARMITLKISVAIVCALIALGLLLTLAPNFCEDFALAVMTCVS
jgi:hypothetical protein